MCVLVWESSRQGLGDSDKMHTTAHGRARVIAVELFRYLSWRMRLRAPSRYATAQSVRAPADSRVNE